MTMRELEKKLRKLDYHQARLYLFCNFISLMLITAYSVMMQSSTVQEVFPEGGDSRKQVMAIFVLTIVGCAAFTVYATALFFRKKSRQIGILMALGSSKKQLAPMLYREILVLGILSSVCGIVTGFPFVMLIWNGFRMLIVDSEEMVLNIRAVGLVIPAVFLVLVLMLACLSAKRYLARTDILDTIQEEHRNEPVKELGKWCGPVGIVILLVGAIAGYEAPGISMRYLNFVPPWWLSLLYTPVFIGLYMILLHTVVHGWHFRRKTFDRDLVSRSMMKFQGKQTINNLLVSTVLIAGACFGIFYVPMLSAGSIKDISTRPYDYLYHYRADQNVPGKAEVETMASGYGLSLKDWHDASYITLGMDGMHMIEEGSRIRYEYRELLHEGKFFSETGFRELTGVSITVEPGTYLAVSDDEERMGYMLAVSSTLLTNMDTRDTLDIGFAGYAHFGMLTDENGFYVLNDADFAEIAEGISGEWSGRAALFNADGEDDYQFAKELFYELIQSSDESCELPSYYNRVYKIAENEAGRTYWGDTMAISEIHYDDPDSSEFRRFWTYMPRFRMLDKNDFIRTYAVFLMMFLFIFLICTTAGCVICYTRCQTIALNNRYVFDDLRKLGAPPAFLKQEVKRQCCTVIRTPSVIGIFSMTFLYTLIMFANDGRLTIDEIMGLSACGVVIVGIGLLLYVVYRKTVKALVKELGIEG